MFIDTHAHLNFQAFDADRDTVIKQSFAAGVKKIINVGSRLDSSESAIALARSYEGLYATVGMHPHHADEYSPQTLVQLEQLATQDKVVAIGEIGLDYHEYISDTKPGISDKSVQKTMFLDQVHLAVRCELPIIVHCRDAMSDLLPLVVQLKSQNPSLTGVFHCYSESLEYAEHLIALGFYLSFTPIITYPKNDSLREVIQVIPLEHILLETDSPYLPPQEKRGLRNTPEAVTIVAQTIANLKKTSINHVEQVTTQNATKLFEFKS